MRDFERICPIAVVQAAPVMFDAAACLEKALGLIDEAAAKGVAEAYPDLKANTNFMQLQTTLEDTENKISYARQSYNDCVLNYNNAIQTFPGAIFAGIFQFKERTGFEAEEGARTVPTVKF